MNDLATTTGAVVAANGGALAAAVGSSHDVGSRPVPTHRGKQVEVVAISGSELCQGKLADHPAWVTTLSHVGKLVVTDRRFIHLTESGQHEGGALDWLVKWPDGRVEILDDTDFNVRFEPMRYPDVISILCKPAEVAP